MHYSGRGEEIKVKRGTSSFLGEKKREGFPQVRKRYFAHPETFKTRDQWEDHYVIKGLAMKAQITDASKSQWVLDPVPASLNCVILA